MPWVLSVIVSVDVCTCMCFYVWWKYPITLVCVHHYVYVFICKRVEHMYGHVQKCVGTSVSICVCMGMYRSMSGMGIKNGKVS